MRDWRDVSLFLDRRQPRPGSPRARPRRRRRRARPSRPRPDPRNPPQFDIDRMEGRGASVSEIFCAEDSVTRTYDHI